MTEEGEPVELRLRKGTIFYKKMQLEDLLKQIHMVADMALKQYQVSVGPDLVKAARQRYDALLEIRGLSSV